MALAGQSSSEAMAKEIVCLKQLVTQTQNELTESVKGKIEYKKRILEELKIALEVKHEEGKKQI